MSLKNSLLTELEAHRQAALSGQELAKRFGVSRNAVWKAVNALRTEGYAIESTPNKGYRLAPECDRLSAGTLSAELTELPVYCFDTLDSTNNEARRRLAGGEKGPFLIAAEEQTAGRGRLGRSFYSPKDTGLYMTLALAPGHTVQSALGITAYAAVCVAEAVERYTGDHLLIKWVNDLYLNGKKVCGILTEAVTDFESGTLEALLVGIGINLRASDVPAELQTTIGFLSSGTPVKNQLAAAIAKGLMAYPPENGNYWAAYRARSLTLGARLRWVQGEQSLEGKALDIDDNGALIVQTDDGNRHTLRSGTIEMLP